MALEYITDDDAVNGVVRTGLIDINGKRLKMSDDKNIGLLVNAPRSHVFIDKISIEQVFKGIELRAAKSITIKEIAIEEFYNDALQILASHVRIGKMLSVSTIEKLYSDKGHSDHIQIFNHLLRFVKDVSIDEIEFYSRNHAKQANIHFTENHYYSRMFLGKLKFYINSMPANTRKYDYALSATNLSDSIIGGHNNKTGDLNFRVKNVKHGYWKSKNNHFVGIDGRRIEKDPMFGFEVHETYPIRKKKKVYINSDIDQDLIRRQSQLAGKEGW